MGAAVAQTLLAPCAFGAPPRILAAALQAGPAAPTQAPSASQTPPTAPVPIEHRIDSLHALSLELQTLSRRVSRSLVQVFSSGYALSDEEEGGSNTAMVTRQKATGSGVIVSADGYIVTNRHVVANARRVRVRLSAATGAAGTGRALPSGKMLEAQVVGVDRDTDLAVLKIDRVALPHLTLGDSDTLRQGQLVMAFGNPLGLENSVSMGVVSSVSRQLRPDDPMIYIQTDAPINPGNSGGPLVDADGHVMGINTFILSQSGGSEGLGFAIPSNIVKNVYEQIRRDGHVHRAQIGVFGQTITPALAGALHLPQDWGVVLADVTPDGPASAAGLKIGDVVLSLDGKTIENARQLQVSLYRYQVGSKVKLAVQRGDEQLDYTVAVVVQEGDPERFADMADPAKNIVPELGILGIDVDAKVAQMLPDLRKKYGVVAAARAGEASLGGGPLELGDVIYAVNTEPVTSVQALRNALRALKDSGAMVLQIERQGKLRYITLENE
jgi:serine protease Do